MKRKGKITSIAIISILIIGSLGFNAIVATKTKKRMIEEKTDNIQDLNKNNIVSVIDGYRVDKADKIGEVGEFTKKLAENNDLGVEITSKRTPTDRFFRNDDDTITAYLSIIPNCYQDENGDWNDYDPSETPKSSTMTLGDSWDDESNCYGYVRYVHGDELFKDEVKKYGCKVYTSGRHHIVIGEHYDEYTGGYWKQYSRGFAQWDISSLPDKLSTAYPGVTNVDLSFYVSGDKHKLYHEKGDSNRQYADLRVMSMGYGENGVKPSNYSTTSNSNPGSLGWTALENLMKDCSDGVPYHNATLVKRSEPGKKTWTLHQSACFSIESRVSDGWFAVGLKDEKENCGGGENAGGILLDGDDTPNDADLVLEITYDLGLGDVALFIEGGMQDGLQSAFHNSAYHGKEVFKSNLGYGSDRVKLIKWPTEDEIEDALRDLADEMGNGNDVFIYLCDHGVGHQYEDSWWTDRFGADFDSKAREGDFVLNPSEKLDTALLTQSEFSDILDEFYGMEKGSGGTGYGTCTIVVEACFSGHFITETSAPHKDAGGDNHIIITATGCDHVSWGRTGSNGYSIFSKYFFNQLKDGETSYGKAWEKTDKYMYNWVKNNPKSIEKETDNIKNPYENIIEILVASNVPGVNKEAKKLSNLIKTTIHPQFYPIDGLQQLLRKDKDIVTQCPLLSDNGHTNHAGTEGPNEVDTLPMNGNGQLARNTYP